MPHAGWPSLARAVRAKATAFDLLAVALDPKAKQPVCKILDLARFAYEEARK